VECGPQVGAPTWQFEFYNYAQVINTAAKLDFALLNFDFFLVILIGNVLMTSMGQLALELNHSVMSIPGLRDMSTWFCSGFKYKCK
jgi:hypothetical protein